MDFSGPLKKIDWHDYEKIAQDNLRSGKYDIVWNTHLENTTLKSIVEKIFRNNRNVVVEILSDNDCLKLFLSVSKICQTDCLTINFVKNLIFSK